MREWWKTKPNCYIFNVSDGTFGECHLVALDGTERSIVRLVDGLEVSVGNLWLSRDPAHMKSLRMTWESAQVKMQKEPN